MDSAREARRTPEETALNGSTSRAWDETGQVTEARNSNDLNPSNIMAQTSESPQEVSKLAEDRSEEKWSRPCIVSPQSIPAREASIAGMFIRDGAEERGDKREDTIVIPNETVGEHSYCERPG